jgi:hypothetical protein
VVSQRGKCLFHVKTPALGDDTLGLLDDDAAVESMVELVVDDLGLERAAVLQNGDGGDVGERLGDDEVGLPPSPPARLGTG